MIDVDEESNKIDKEAHQEIENKIKRLYKQVKSGKMTQEIAEEISDEQKED